MKRISLKIVVLNEPSEEAQDNLARLIVEQAIEKLKKIKKG